MKRLRWQILVVVFTLVVVALLLLIQQPSGTPSLPEPGRGGIYTEALVGAFGRLNPLFDLNNPADRDVDRLLFSSLIKFDSRGVPYPDLAESWGVSPDGIIYNVTLRANTFWHDGMPVTSDDVLFTLSLLRSEYSAFPDDVRAMWDLVEITRLDEKNIKFVLPEPFVPFLDYLTFGILPKHLLDTVAADQMLNVDFNFAPVGSGPYRFDHLMVEDGQITGVVLAAWESYYGQVPYVEQIVFRYYTEAGAALTAYEEGEVLGISSISTDILQPALDEPSLSFYSSRMPNLTMVLFDLGNNELPFFQDRRVRRALMLGLNRQWMVDRILHGQAVVADSPLLRYTWAYYEGVEHLAYDPDAAIALLRDAGYTLPADGTVRFKDDVPLSFTMVHPDDSLHTRLAQLIQENWAAIGVDVTLRAVSYEALLDSYLAPRAFEAALVDLDLSRSYDPDPYPFWHQAEATGGQNYSRWDNRTASEYIEQARVLADPEVRLRLYRNFQVIFARDLPALPLFTPVYSYAVDQRVLGVQVAPLFEPADRFNGIASWYLVTRRALEQTAEPDENP